LQLRYFLRILFMNQTIDIQEFIHPQSYEKLSGRKKTEITQETCSIYEIYS
jgi:hypothetical protein